MCTSLGELHQTLMCIDHRGFLSLRSKPEKPKRKPERLPEKKVEKKKGQSHSLFLFSGTDGQLLPETLLYATYIDKFTKQKESSSNSILCVHLQSHRLKKGYKSFIQI